MTLSAGLVPAHLRELAQKARRDGSPKVMTAHLASSLLEAASYLWSVHEDEHGDLLDRDPDIETCPGCRALAPIREYLEQAGGLDNLEWPR